MPHHFGAVTLLTSAAPISARSAAGYNLNDLQTIAGDKLTAGKLGRSDRFAIVLDDHAARQERSR